LFGLAELLRGKQAFIAVQSSHSGAPSAACSSNRFCLFTSALLGEFRINGGRYRFHEDAT
jgi:hypothetical protein